MKNRDNNMKHLIILLTVLLSCSTSWAQREIININRSWQYVPGWQVQKDVSTTVNLPHTFNLDALSGKWDYYRGLANYVKTIETPTAWKGKKVFIRFKGANQTADLYVNSKHVGQHQGGYTAFTWDITPYLTIGSRNTLWVRLTNAINLDIMPLLGDFNMYGGIYRDVELIVVPTTHFCLEDFSSSGVYVKQTKVSDVRADVQIRALIDGPAGGRATRVNFALLSAAGDTVGMDSKLVELDAIGSTEVDASFTLINPHLWHSVEDPYLYHATVTLAQEAGRKTITLDSLTTSVGLRYFKVDEKNQFYLNGKPFRIQGVGRHQDWALLGNALFPENHQRDVELMLGMGVNAVRLTHYPQDPYFIDLCDRAGIIVWSEIPFVGPGGYRDKGFNDSEAFMENGRTQLQEMIRQLYNHPSILFWGLFNELTQRGDDPLHYVRSLNTLAKEEDSTRLTVAASNQDGDLNFVTDLIGFNQYVGWYGGEPKDFNTWGERLRREWPKLKAGVSEYGAGGSIYQHSDTLQKVVPESYWHPEQWQTFYHETYWRTIASKNYFWGTFLWVMFDFGAAHRTEGLRPGINDKGMVTFDRQMPKDAYYFYKANWNSKDKFVYIAERRWQNRPYGKQTIKVFSNCQSAELFINGKAVLTEASNDGYGTFVWKNIGMPHGENLLTVRSGHLADSCSISIL
ncbi:MAG: glycoside hydrolase family 2 TIM barrel-domain containing protein [Mucinivorans sp.]